METFQRSFPQDPGKFCTLFNNAEANKHALTDGSRIFSVYQVTPELKLWIITEAEDDKGNRVATTLLLPSEY